MLESIDSASQKQIDRCLMPMLAVNPKTNCRPALTLDAKRGAKTVQRAWCATYGKTVAQALTISRTTARRYLEYAPAAI